MKARPLLATFALALFLAVPALAQAPDKKAADAFFKEGRAAFDKGDFATACTKFEQSQAADPAVGTLVNLGVCEERLGKLADAQMHLTAALPALPARDDRVAFVKELLAKLEPRVPTITFTLAPGSPPQTTIHESPQGKPLPFDSPLALNPGAHAFTITAPGRPASRLNVDLAESQRERRAIAAAEAPKKAEPVGPTPAEQRAEANRKLRRTLGFVAGGIGVAGLGVAAVTGIVLVGQKGEIDENCPAQKCNPKGLSLVASGKSTPLVPINMVGWVTGIVGLGAGTVLIVTSRSPSAPTSSTAVGPTFFAGGGGLGASGTF